MSSLGKGDGGPGVGKKAKKRQGGAWATAHGVLRVTEGNGKQQGVAVVVDVGQHSTRCRKFSSSSEEEDAAWFATSTEAVRPFREFLFGEDTVGSGGDKSKLSHGRVSDSGDVVEASQSPRGRLRSFVCLRQNRWTGLRYTIVMARLANGQLRAISFHDKRISKLRRDGSRSSCEDELLRKAITFLRSISFKHWREQVPIEAPSQHYHGGLERSLKHVGAFVGYEKGEKVDCSCGKNRSRGQMVLCECCGTREHLECSGYRSDAQMPADHICSACLRAQKEEVIVINLDEQEEYRLLSSGDSWTHSKARGRRDESICCLCGCEDNEEFETMIQPCTCDGGAVFAHPSCVSLAMECLTPKDRNKQSSTCQACGRQGSDREAKPATLKRTSRRPSNSDNPTKNVKRLRSTTQPPGKVEVDENLTGKHENEGKSLHERIDPEPRKPEVSLLGRRFSDVASTVPIKKRRIQIMDSIRSPSPPSRSPSPSLHSNIIKPDVSVDREGTTSRMDVDDAPDGKDGACKAYGQPNGVESGHLGKRVDNCTVKLGRKTEGGTEVYDERLPRCTENKVEEEETEIHDYEIPTTTSTFESFKPISNCGEFERLTAEQVNYEVAGCSEAEPKIDSKQVGGENAHGDRSHWDLNMYMDAWERPCEDFSCAVDPNQLAQKSGSDISGETEEHDGQSIGKAEEQGERLDIESERDNSIESKEACPEEINKMDSDVLDNSSTGHDTHANLGTEADAEAEKFVENNLGPQSHVALQTVVGNEDDNEKVDYPSHGDADAPLDVDANCVSAETDGNGMKVEKTEEVTAVSKEVKNAEDLAMKGTCDPEYKEEFAEYDTFEEEDEPDPDPVDKTKVEEAQKAEEGQISTDDWVEDAGEELEAEDVDYGDSEEGEDAVDEKASPSGHAEVDYDDAEQGEIHESSVKQENGAENRPESPGKERVPGLASDENSEGKDGQQNLNGSNEGSKEGEGAPQKKSSITGRIKSSGWDQLPEGFETAEDALRASKDLLRRGGRPISWSGSRGAPGARLSGSSRASQFESSYERFRHEDPSWSRHDHHDHRGNEMYEADSRFYSREFGRGRSRGSASSPLVSRRGDIWMNGSTRPQGQWAGPKHHLSPPGRFTDGVGFGPHGQANAAAVAAAKVESSGFVVAPDGTITKAGSPGAAGRSAGRPFPGGGRNPAPLMLNPSRGTDPGLSDAMAPRGGMGPGRGLGLSPGLRVNVGMGMGAGMGVSPGMRGGLPVSRGVIDRHPYGPGVDSQVSRTPSSRSGYPGDHPDKWDRRDRDLSPSGFKGRRSPGVRDHRRSRSRSRSSSPRKSGNPALRASRSPGHVKAKEVRESSPAGRSSLPSPPKLPLPPPPPRGQRSPPAGLKRLSDKRDGDRRFFEHEYHQPAEREHRTSGWDLGPADVGESRRASGHEAARERVSKFDDMDRRVDSHDRRIGAREESRRDPSKPMRRDKPSNSSRHIGSRDGEDDVAPRRRRPPS